MFMLKKKLGFNDIIHMQMYVSLAMEAYPYAFKLIRFFILFC